MLVVFLGPPGAGKGTQAVRIAEKYDLPHISTGDMLRAAVAEGAPLGHRVDAIMSAGELVPDDVMLEVVEERLRKPDCTGGAALDGYPRTRGQAKTLDPLAERVGLGQVDLVLLLDAPEDELIRRISGRREEDTERRDDNEDVVRERLRVYRRDTAPLIGYYRDRGVLREIDGLGDVDEVFERLDAAMREAVDS